MAKETATITNLEELALRSGINLSDGHPRMCLTDSQQGILARLGNFFTEGSMRSVHEIEHEAHVAFLSALGQFSALSSNIEIRTCYSSSTAIDIVAKGLRQAGSIVGVLTPTFDNIPDLLRGNGCKIVPISQNDLKTLPTSRFDGLGAVFIVWPNNPTGEVLSEVEFTALCEYCKSRGIVVIMDACFRAQTSKTQYDSYRVAINSGAQCIIIEDTGKLWPVHELKMGLLTWTANVTLGLHRNHSDLMLSASPFILCLVREFALDGANGGFEQLRNHIARNRAYVRTTLKEHTASICDTSEISVELLTLPQAMAPSTVYEAARSVGVHVLPTRQFFWDDSKAESRLIRVSLARDHHTLVEGIFRLKKVFGEVSSNQTLLSIAD